MCCIFANNKITNCLQNCVKEIYFIINCKNYSYKKLIIVLINLPQIRFTKGKHEIIT